MLGDLALDVDGAEDGAAGAGEGDHESVALILDLGTAVVLNLGPDDLVVPLEEVERLLVTDGGGEMGEALHVGEEDGDGGLDGRA